MAVHDIRRLQGYNRAVYSAVAERKQDYMYSAVKEEEDREESKKKEESKSQRLERRRALHECSNTK